MEFRESFRVVFAVTLSGEAVLVRVPPDWDEQMTTSYLVDNNFTGPVPEEPGVYRATVHAYGSDESDGPEPPPWEFCLEEIEPFEIDP